VAWPEHEPVAVGEAAWDQVGENDGRLMVKDGVRVSDGDNEADSVEDAVS